MTVYKRYRIHLDPWTKTPKFPIFRRFSDIGFTLPFFPMIFNGSLCCNRRRIHHRQGEGLGLTIEAVPRTSCKGHDIGPWPHRSPSFSLNTERYVSYIDSIMKTQWGPKCGEKPKVLKIFSGRSGILSPLLAPPSSSTPGVFQLRSGCWWRWMYLTNNSNNKRMNCKKGAPKFFVHPFHSLLSKTLQKTNLPPYQAYQASQAYHLIFKSSSDTQGISSTGNSASNASSKATKYLLSSVGTETKPRTDGRTEKNKFIGESFPHF